MFDSLSSRLGDVFDALKKRGALSEADVTTALRDVRVALLEADVALSVVKDFIEQVKERALGEEVMKSITPGQMVVKIVNDHLTEMLGSDAEALVFATSPPSAIMLVGLQGSGKTTTTAKLALHLKNTHKKKVLMASLDVQRPAAQEQLAVLGREAGVETLPVVIIACKSFCRFRSIQLIQNPPHPILRLRRNTHCSVEIQHVMNRLIRMRILPEVYRRHLRHFVNLPTVGSDVENRRLCEHPIQLRQKLNSPTHQFSHPRRIVWNRPRTLPRRTLYVCATPGEFVKRLI